ncbi:MAG: sugar-transfer associated ATP-grasp domain-containing protein, partial [Pseudomonadota bacterium]
DETPLQLEKHLRLRKELSTVQPSSIMDVWNAAPSGAKLDACRRFLSARFGPGKLSSGEFIQFGFCDPSISDAEIGTFAGKQAQQAFNKIYNDRTWYAVTKNKIAFEALMRGGGMPCPETIAIYDRKGRGAGAPVLKKAEALEAFLLDKKNHPVFCKPTTGLLSIGSFRIDKAEDKNLVVNGEHAYPVKEVIKYIQGVSKKGYLFQRVLEPHDDFKKIGCKVISSVRFLVLNREEQAEIHSCVLKVPAKGEVADNFWRSGSIIAAINLDNGKFDRAVLKNHDSVEILDAKSDEAKQYFQFELPDFEAAKNCVLQASRFLAGVRVQSWDVALTRNGPVLLEVNFGGDLNLSQLSSGKGVITRNYCQILRESGYKGRLPS